MLPFADLNFEPLSDSAIWNDDEEIVLENDGVVDEQGDNESEKRTFSILNGHLLPLPLRPKIRNKLTGIPLKEIDPFYKKKDTFIVIGRGSGIFYRFGGASAIAKSDDGFRQQAVAILTHGLFNYFLVFAVLLNCIFYGISPFESTVLDYEILLKVCHYVFLIVYIVELGLKILARGIYNTRNPFSAICISWTWLDVFVILVGIGSIAEPSNRTLGALNGFRALKLIPLIPSWLSGYNLLFRRTFKGLCNVVIFTLVLTSLLALVASEFYSDTLRHKCVLSEALTKSYAGGWDIPEDAFLTYPNSSEFRHCSNFTWNDPCPEKYVCVSAGENPAQGHVGFDSFSVTKLTLINLISQDFAEYVYEKIWTIHGPPHILYFIVVFFVGTFATGILVYAVLGNGFERGFSKFKTEYDGEEENATEEAENAFPPTSTWLKWRARGAQIVTHENFDIFISVIIILDVVTFALDHHGLEEFPDKLNFLMISNKLINFVYCLECVLKIVFVGIRTYWRNRWNRFDFFVVIFILLNVFMHGVILHSGIMIAVLKVVPRWPVLNFLFVIMFKWVWIWWIIGLNGIALFLFAHVGYVRFGDVGAENATMLPESEQIEISRWNMTDFWHSIRLIIRAFCGEWIETMWDLAQIFPGLASITFMISCGTIGNFLRKCLGLGIMLTTAHQLTITSALETKPTSFQRMLKPCTWIATKMIALLEEKPKEDPSNGPLSHYSRNGYDVPKETDDGGNEPIRTHVTPNPPAEQNELKMFLGKIFDNFVYSVFTSALIVALTVLAIYQELAAEILFVGYFGMELILRVVAIGFGRQLVSLGLFYDAMMVINSFLAMCLTMSYGVGHLGTFRVLMLVSRFHGLSIVRNQFWQQIKNLWQYFLAIFYIWFAFALFGVQLHMGRFYKCIADGKPNAFNRMDCMEGNHTWENSAQNFDSVPNGLWTLFYVATRNGWLNAIHNAEDATYEHGPRVKDSSPVAMIYFLMFLIFGLLFPLYIICGLMYHNLKQTSWIQLLRIGYGGNETGETKTMPSSDFAHFWNFKLVQSHYFELWVCLIIVADCIVHALQLSASAEHEHWMSIFRLVILFLYTAELILRGLTLRKDFFKQWLNVLLLIVVLGSIVDFVILEVGNVGYSFDAFRILRLPHLLSLDRVGIYKFPEWSAFRKALSNTFPVLSCINAFYVLIYVSYAIFGEVTFKGVPDFESWSAMTTLFKIASISGWESIYERIAQGDCKGDHCGYPVTGAIYEVTFIIITIFCFVNMYLAFVMEIMEQLKQGANHKEMTNSNGKVEEENDMDGQNVKEFDENRDTSALD